MNQFLSQAKQLREINLLLRLEHCEQKALCKHFLM